MMFYNTSSRAFSMPCLNIKQCLRIYRSTTTKSVSRRRRKMNADVAKTHNPNLSFHVIGTGAQNTGSSLLLNSKSHIIKSILFNCGEGTIRTASDRDIKINKVRNVLLTSTSWSHIGGLVSLCTYFKISTEELVKIHGPPGINYILEQYLWYRKSHLQVIEYTQPKGIIQVENNDNFVQVIPLSSCKEDSNETSFGEVDTEAIINKDVTLAYLINFAENEGHFLLEKCVQLNVPPGPLLLELKKGKDITLDDGSVIKASDVRTGVNQSRTVLVIDILSSSHLEAAKKEMFEKHNPDIVIHFSPGELVDSTAYISFISTFSPSTQHLFLNENNNCLSMEAVYKIQHQLNQINNEVFPLLNHNLPLKYPESNNFESNQKHSEINKIIYPPSGLEFCVRPTYSINWNNVPVLNPSEYIESCYNIDGFKETCLKCNGDYSEGNEYPHVVFLGTVSSVSSPYRNTSSILLNISETQSLLLDCGEGTYAQIMRHYGSKKGRQILMNLKGIYISHKHIDHHLGLYGVIIGRRNAFFKEGITNISPVPVLYPLNITKALDAIDFIDKSIVNDITRISNLEFLYLSKQEKSPAYHDVLNSLGMDAITMAFVEHCRYSFGVSLTHQDGWKIVYSGDTMPSQHLVNIGKNCDLLIHEATFDDHLESDAESKKHSTTSQAIDAGDQMNAKAIILTHFSVRYCNIPFLSEENMSKVGVAFDNMKVNLHNAKQLHHLNPAIKCLFSEEYEVVKDKIFKKLREKAINENEGRTHVIDISSEIYKQVYE